MSYAQVLPSASLPQDGEAGQQHMQTSVASARLPVLPHSGGWPSSAAPQSAMRAIFTPLLSPHPKSAMNYNDLPRADAPASPLSASRRSRARPMSMGMNLGSALPALDPTEPGSELFALEELEPSEPPSASSASRPRSSSVALSSSSKSLASGKERQGDIETGSAGPSTGRLASIELSPRLARKSLADNANGTLHAHTNGQYGGKTSEEEEDENEALIYRSENDIDTVLPLYHDPSGSLAADKEGAARQQTTRSTERSALLNNNMQGTSSAAFERVQNGEASWMWISVVLVTALSIVSLLVSYDVIDWPGDGLGNV